MATSSITKDFKVVDIEAYKKLVDRLEQEPPRKIVHDKQSSLERGKELLKQFSFR